MNTTTNEHHDKDGGLERARPLKRRLSCFLVALVLSAGIGAVIGGAGSGAQPPVSPPDARCESTPPTGIVLDTFRTANTACTEPPVLVRTHTITA